MNIEILRMEKLDAELIECLCKYSEMKIEKINEKFF